jgi:ribosomal protein L37AE/L43A
MTTLFRPSNHPLLDVTTCPKCHKKTVSLPAYPGDYFDCESCGHSWPETPEQLEKMHPSTTAK